MLTDDLYEQAESAVAGGDLDTAEGLLRTAVSEGAPPRTVKLLARVLERQGRRLDKVGDRHDEALARYEEAYRLHPSRERHQRFYARALRRAIARALMGHDFDRARALVASDTLRNAEDLLVRQLAAPSLKRLLDAAPLTTLLPRRGGEADAAGKTLVIIEDGVEPYLLPAYLPALAPVDVYSETGVRDAVAADIELYVTPLARAGGADFGADANLSGPADEVSSAVRDVLRSALPTELVNGGGLDLLEAMAFQFDDMAFRAAERVTGVMELLRDPRYESVVFVLGNGALHRCVASELVERSADRPCYFLWCSRTHDRYDVQVSTTPPRPVPPHPTADRRDSAAQDQRSVIARARARLGRVRRRARRLAGRFRWRAGGSPEAVAREGAGASDSPRARCALVARPTALHVGSLTAVAEQLPDDHEVIALPLDSRSKFADVHRAYDALKAARPAVRIETSPARAASRVDNLTSRRTDEALEKVLASGVLADLEVEGTRVGPLVEALLVEVLGRLPAERRFAERFRQYLDETPPDVILVSPDRVTRVRVACLLARHAGIPTVFPQVLFFSPSPRYKPLQADYACVLDDHHRHLFTEHFGADPSQVVVTGIPRFDRLLALRERAMARPGEGEGVLLALQSLSTGYNDALVDAALDAVAPLDARLVVKLHPHDRASNEERYREIVEARLGPDRGRVHWRTDIYDLVLEADVVVSTFSNVIFEAAVLERLTVCANFTGDPLPVPFVEQGLAVGCSSPKELADVIERALGDSEFREDAFRQRAPYFERNSHLLQSRAADRVAEFVDRIVAERAPDC